MTVTAERHGEEFREDLRGALPKDGAAQARRVMPGVLTHAEVRTLRATLKRVFAERGPVRVAAG